MSVVRAETKRRQILDAARQLFLERGVDGASTDGIAGAAGVSKETLYRYYPSKEELLVAVMRGMTVDRLFAPSASTLPTAATRADLEASLTSVVRDALDRLMDPAYLALCRVAFGESGRRPHLLEMFRAAVPEAGRGVLVAFLEDARSQGLLRSDLDVDVAARLLIGPLLTWALMDGLMAGREAPRPPPKEALEQLVRVFLEGAC
jgi:TetR/AcrR family transcriptional regulator, mexJK operon transcriptional repressor